MDSKRRIDAVLRYAKLDNDERIILEELVRQGYAPNGQPYGRAGAIPAKELAVLLPIVPEEGDEDAEIVREQPDEPGIKKIRRKRGEQGLNRALRRIINRLVIRRGIPIMCEPGPGGGYYLPAGDEEVEANHARFHTRAMTGLMKATRSRRSAYADAVLQLTLGYDGPEGDAVRARLGMPRRNVSSPPAWVQVVTKLLERVKGDPQHYADQIRCLQEQFGDIFVPRHKVAELRDLSGRLQRVLRELEPAELPDREGMTAETAYALHSQPDQRV
jgi:hypothetical protein